ncbi:hypothetical protein ACFSQD_01930 [Flavihumibacter stibioxidans]|uniref:DUF3316 domain-containing protein n=1 Tax=Flavihumibacter stibioxidans TaxID=1834163 RepID=A0ABR7MBA6_9BACT|nr:hypothetical protein [Flavihumibacter stibioxidans]MBC6492242.1 hypothetical protein [Flavihumibacter stibioxidans]
MKRKIWITGWMLCLATITRSQELYIFSDPASNVPAKSLSAKLTMRLADNQLTGKLNQRYMPELMAGISKSLMFRASTSFSDFYSDRLRWESVKGYLKWRFYSQDGIHRHFRMAAFVDGAYSRNDLVFDEMNLDGDNSGIQAGIIGTQLVNKLAVSGTASLMRVFDEKFGTVHGAMHDQNAFNYSLSAGYLLFPRNYSDYEQVNLNLYVELLGMKGLERGMYYMDVAPALQLIFNSSSKLNLGARFEAGGNMDRIARNNYFLSFESTFLNAFGKKRK